jgi:hypothetical protein
VIKKLNLNPLLDFKKVIEKQPSPSTSPNIQESSREGMTISLKGIIGGKLFLISFSLNEDRKIKNLALLVGNTIFPLNKRQKRIIFLISCILNICIFFLVECSITFPNPKFFLI